MSIDTIISMTKDSGNQGIILAFLLFEAIVMQKKKLLSPSYLFFLRVIILLIYSEEFFNFFSPRVSLYFQKFLSVLISTLSERRLGWKQWPMMPVLKTILTSWLPIFMARHHLHAIWFENERANLSPDVNTTVQATRGIVKASDKRDKLTN